MKTGTVKTPRSVIIFPTPDRAVNLVDAWGCRYQKEEKQTRPDSLQTEVEVKLG